MRSINPFLVQPEGAGNHHHLLYRVHKGHLIKLLSDSLRKTVVFMQQWNSLLQDPEEARSINEFTDVAGVLQRASTAGQSLSIH